MQEKEEGGKEGDEEKKERNMEVDKDVGERRGGGVDARTIFTKF